jgi:type I restriction enzyme S subunit
VQLCSTGFAVLRSNGAVEPGYLFRFTLTEQFVDAVTPHQTGTHYPATSDRVVLSQSIPLPPLAEQRRIVAKVEELLAQVNAARGRLGKLPTILKRFRQAVLAAACDGRLTADWREAQGCSESASDLLKRLNTNVVPVRTDLDLFELPESWNWVALRTLLDSREAFCYGVVQPGEDDEQGVFLVRAGDLSGGTVDLTSLRRIPKVVDKEYSRSRLRGGEVLVTVVGAGIGEAAIAPMACAGFNIARAVAKLPIRAFSAVYALRWLQAQKAREWMDNDAREVARPTLNLEQLQTLPVPLPPTAEQEEIVRRVDALFALADKIEARVQAATERVEKITQAILAKAFRGELVPTEAELARQEGRDYEPASVLLERIRASRPETNAKPRRRRTTLGKKSV